MGKIFQTIVCSISISLSTYAYAEQARIFSSPDGALKAKVISASKNCDESRIEIYAKKGLVLSAQDYTSSDCEHGLINEHSEWTPDSHFFVYSMYSSGGHQPWLSHTFFYARQNNKMYNLADYLPPVAKSKFWLKAPDLITIEIWTPFTPETNLEKSVILPISFRLGDIQKGEKRAKEFFGE